MKQLSKLCILMCGAILASCDLANTDNNRVTGVSFEKEKLYCVKGESVSLAVNIVPENASTRNIIWSSSDNNVATVDASGKISAVKEGSASIFAKTVDGGFTDSCKLFVYPQYSTPHYLVRTEQNYAYVGDKIDFIFLQVDNKVTDLTNTGNAKITSSFSINGISQAASSHVCNGTLTLDSLVTAKEDSVAVCVVYDNGTKKDTTFSSGLRVYNNPALSIKVYKTGAMSILLSGTAKHLWKDDCTIFDNGGTDYTAQIHYDGSTDYVLDIKPNMWDNTYTFFYGPEKRSSSIVVPAKPK